jgi:hypothetical protein
MIIYVRDNSIITIFRSGFHMDYMPKIANEQGFN